MPSVLQSMVARTTSVLFLLPALALAAADSVPRAALRAGAAAVDVTPTHFPLNMPGGFNANMAQGANDRLHARALVLDDGSVTLALVVVDSLGIGRETIDAAKAMAAGRCGISADKILVSATHTHSGPSSGSTQAPPGGKPYRTILVEGIAKAIASAHAALRPAAIGAAAHPLPEEVFNRRWYLKPGKMTPNPFGKMDEVRTNPGTSADVIDRPAGPTDPDVTILAVKDSHGKPLALLANYSLHYVGATPKGMVSADYYGEFARLVPERVAAGDGFVAMMSNGTSGDINNIPFLVNRPRREPFEQIRIVAGKAADAAGQAWKSIGSFRPDVRLGMLQRQVTLQYRRPTPEQVAAAKAVLAVKDEAEKARLPRLAENYARRTIAAAERADKTLNVPIQAIRIGDLAICSLPFEAFCEIGLELKKRSPFPRTMAIGLANAVHGYLPTPRQHKLGGYETWLGSNSVQEDTSDVLIGQLGEMLTELARSK